MTGKVLIVDDEPGVRELVENFVKHAGHTVFSAADGIEALEFIKAENFDIVISDIQMPHMDGLTLTEAILNIQPDTIVILMTGYASVNSAVEAIKKGVFDYILKPFQNIHIILHAIQRGLDRKHLLHERNALFENLRRTNDELTYNRILLNDKLKEMDTELSRRVERLTTLFDISRSTSSITDLGELLHKIVESITQAMKDSACAIWLVDLDSEQLEKAATIGFKNNSSLPESFHVNEGELGAIASSDLARVFKGLDELSDPILKNICHDEGISALIIVPLC
ncbi:response regulator, partial [Candidatus Omnitrophota bacterium]